MMSGAMMRTMTTVDDVMYELRERVGDVGPDYIVTQDKTREWVNSLEPARRYEELTEEDIDRAAEAILAGQWT